MLGQRRRQWPNINQHWADVSALLEDAFYVTVGVILKKLGVHTKLF